MSNPDKPLTATLASTCRTHSTAKGFCDLRMSKLGSSIVLDPHVDGSCMIWLDEDKARAVRDKLTKWHSTKVTTWMLIAIRRAPWTATWMLIAVRRAP